MIFFVGTFPPPTHGMSLVNEAVCRELRLAGMDVGELNTAPSTLKRDFISRSSRWTLILRAWARLLTAARRHDHLYLSISGGWGQIYDLATLLIARARGMRCIVHYHSFAYLDRQHALTALAVRVARQDAIHVALCQGMAGALQKHYAVRRVVVLSNINFFPHEIPERASVGLRSVGFLSNLTHEKGADTVLRLAAAIQSKRLPLRVVVAGPCADIRLEGLLQGAVASGAVEWRGAVYDEEKSGFWRDIDAFVFPTCYANEAEPLVLFEALMNAVPVISYARGCIPEQLGNAGVLVSPADEFVGRALQTLQDWRADRSEFERQQHLTAERYRALKAESAQQWQRFLASLSESMCSG